jgi:hypothetical protein
VRTTMIERPVDADRRVQSRLRHARLWLSVTQFVHGSTFVFVLLAVAGGSIRSTGAAVLAAALAIGPLVMLLRWERRTPSSHRPAHWPRRGSAVVVPHAAAFGIAAGELTGTGSPSWLRVVLFACGLLVVELVAIALASRALRHPLSAELGEMDVEVLAKIRPAAGDRPSWLANDEVLVTGDALITTVRPDSKWAFAERIGLGDVVDVEIRRTTGEDGPWFEAEGQAFWPPSGDAVVVTHGSGTRLLPVYDPHGFADVLRARVRCAGEDDER